MFSDLITRVLNALRMQKYTICVHASTTSIVNARSFKFLSSFQLYVYAEYTRTASKWDQKCFSDTIPVFLELISE